MLLEEDFRDGSAVARGVSAEVRLVQLGMVECRPGLYSIWRQFPNSGICFVRMRTGE